MLTVTCLGVITSGSGICAVGALKVLSDMVGFSIFAESEVSEVTVASDRPDPVVEPEVSEVVIICGASDGALVSELSEGTHFFRGFSSATIGSVESAAFIVVGIISSVWTTPERSASPLTSASREDTWCETKQRKNQRRRNIRFME